MSLTTRLPRGLESMIGTRYMQQKEDAQLREDLMQCPPIDPRLLRHLALKFQDPTDTARPTHPQLAQLLTIQYGCDKVIKYLEKQYAIQSEVARREREK